MYVLHWRSCLTLGEFPFQTLSRDQFVIFSIVLPYDKLKDSNCQVKHVICPLVHRNAIRTDSYCFYLHLMQCFLEIMTQRTFVGSIIYYREPDSCKEGCFRYIFRPRRCFDYVSWMSHLHYQRFIEPAWNTHDVSRRRYVTKYCDEV